MKRIIILSALLILTGCYVGGCTTTGSGNARNNHTYANICSNALWELGMCR